MPPEAAAPPVSLEDKYTKEGRVYVTGTQALVRLPLLQRQLDRAQGLRTAGYISGYRGSPLGGFDRELQRAGSILAENDIVFQPGVNEELAATAVWGAQQVGLRDRSEYDGVCSASGTARGRGWTVAGTPYATPTWPAALPRAVCWP